MYSQLGALDHRFDQLVNHMLAELVQLGGRQVLEGEVGDGFGGFGHWDHLLCCMLVWKSVKRDIVKVVK